MNDEAQEIQAEISTDHDEMMVKLKSSDGTELCVEGCIRTMLACGEKMAMDFDVDFTGIIEEYLGEKHIDEVREGMH